MWRERVVGRAAGEGEWRERAAEVGGGGGRWGRVVGADSARRRTSSVAICGGGGVLRLGALSVRLELRRLLLQLLHMRLCEIEQEDRDEGGKRAG